MSKFTKIKKWAKDNNYTCEDVYGYGNNPAIKITIDQENSFTCEVRDSTIYHSIKGVKGNAGGLYLTHERKSFKGRSYGFCKDSQKEMIHEMEYKIKKINGEIKEYQFGKSN